MSDYRLVPAGGRQFWIRPKTSDVSLIAEVQDRPIAVYDPQAGDRWLDAGANIGQFSVLYASQVESIVALEPEPENFVLLSDNLRENHCINVQAIPAALVGDDVGMRTFYLNPKANKGCHSFYRWQSQFVPTEVPCVNVNAMLERFNISCIKMDVEGAEVELTRAIEDWDRIRHLFLEYHHAIHQDGDLIVFRAIIDRLSKHFPVLLMDEPAQHERYRMLVASRKGVQIDGWTDAVRFFQVDTTSPMGRGLAGGDLLSLTA